MSNISINETIKLVLAFFQHLKTTVKVILNPAWVSVIIVCYHSVIVIVIVVIIISIVIIIIIFFLLNVLNSE